MSVTKDSPDGVRPSLEMSLTYCQQCGQGSAARADGPYRARMAHVNYLTPLWLNTVQALFKPAGAAVGLRNSARLGRSRIERNQSLNVLLDVENGTRPSLLSLCLQLRGYPNAEACPSNVFAFMIFCCLRKYHFRVNVFATHARLQGANVLAWLGPFRIQIFIYCILYMLLQLVICICLSLTLSGIKSAQLWPTAGDWLG